MQLLKPRTGIIGTAWQFQYDGGAVAVFNTGLIVPAGCIFTDVRWIIPTGTVSGGGGTMNLGWAGNDTALVGAEAAGAINKNFSLNVLSTGLEIIFSIKIAAFTAGEVKMHITYQQSFLN